MFNHLQNFCNHGKNIRKQAWKVAELAHWRHPETTEILKYATYRTNLANNLQNFIDRDSTLFENLHHEIHSTWTFHDLHNLIDEGAS